MTQHSATLAHSCKMYTDNNYYCQEACNDWAARRSSITLPDCRSCTNKTLKHATIKDEIGKRISNMSLMLFMMKLKDFSQRICYKPRFCPTNIIILHPHKIHRSLECTDELLNLSLHFFGGILDNCKICTKISITVQLLVTGRETLSYRERGSLIPGERTSHTGRENLSYREREPLILGERTSHTGRENLSYRERGSLIPGERTSHTGRENLSYREKDSLIPGERLSHTGRETLSYREREPREHRFVECKWEKVKLLTQAGNLNLLVIFFNLYVNNCVVYNRIFTNIFIHLLLKLFIFRHLRESITLFFKLAVLELVYSIFILWYTAKFSD